MKTLTNTTSETVSIVIKGTEYSIESGEVSEPLSEEVATLWNRTHAFLVMNDIGEVKTQEKVQEEIIEEIEEAKKAPKKSIVEKVKKEIKKKSKK